MVTKKAQGKTGKPSDLRNVFIIRRQIMNYDVDMTYYWLRLKILWPLSRTMNGSVSGMGMFQLWESAVAVALPKNCQTI